MKDHELEKVLRYISHIPNEREREEATELVLKAIAESITLERLRKVSYTPKEKKPEEEGLTFLKFTKKEIETMPRTFQNLFAVNDKIITVRMINGIYYQARYRRDGYNVSACARDFGEMKFKFLQKLKEAELNKQHRKYPPFSEVVEEWLKIKKNTAKDSTYNSYSMLVNVYVVPAFGDKHINEIDRKTIQDFLFGLVDSGKNRTAHKIKQLLNNIFTMLAEDYEIKNPVKKVVLAPYVVKKGRAFSKEEELAIIKQCETTSFAGNSAMLVLLYTGMRVGELKKMEVYDDYITCVSEKTRKGYAEITRKIPMSPMLKKVLHLIDFSKVKGASEFTVRDALKRIFPDRHSHEFRYTFITRAKECGCNPEVVMIWTGHESDSDVKTSRVDRGYTTYSEEYMFSEIKKYDYQLQ